MLVRQRAWQLLRPRLGRLRRGLSLKSLSDSEGFSESEEEAKFKDLLEEAAVYGPGRSVTGGHKVGLEAAHPRYIIGLGAPSCFIFAGNGKKVFNDFAAMFLDFLPASIICLRRIV
jgi:hypothetical protein